jgi:hypothetical protein
MRIEFMTLKRVLLVIILLPVISCSSEKPGVTGPAGNSAADGGQSEITAPGAQPADDTEAALEIVPHEAARNTELRLTAKGFSLADVRTEWMVNGQPAAGPEGPVFKAETVKKGDVVQAKAYPKDEEFLSNTVRIGNSPPRVVKFRLVPDKAGNAMSVEAESSDPDEDEVTLLYEWTNNGEPAGNGSKIEGALRRGDKLSVKITPYDGESYGRPVVKNLTVANAAPQLSGDGKYVFDGKTFSRVIEAVDPDGDTLTYALKSAPEGMTIDPSSGRINWNVPDSFSGKASYIISVTDGHGGEVHQTFIFELAPE